MARTFERLAGDKWVPREVQQLVPGVGHQVLAIDTIPAPQPQLQIDNTTLGEILADTVKAEQCSQDSGNKTS